MAKKLAYLVEYLRIYWTRLVIFKQIPVISAKIAKIGTVDPEIICLLLKKEITEGKIYSPVGKFAERAK